MLCVSADRRVSDSGLEPPEALDDPSRGGGVLAVEDGDAGDQSLGLGLKWLGNLCAIDRCLFGTLRSIWNQAWCGKTKSHRLHLRP